MHSYKYQDSVVYGSVSMNSFLQVYKYHICQVCSCESTTRKSTFRTVINHKSEFGYFPTTPRSRRAFYVQLIATKKDGSPRGATATEALRRLLPHPPPCLLKTMLNTSIFQIKLTNFFLSIILGRHFFFVSLFVHSTSMKMLYCTKYFLTNVSKVFKNSDLENLYTTSKDMINELFLHQKT